MATLRPSYKIEQRVLDATSIAAIALPANQRKVRKGHVKGLYDQLCEGKHFETPVCINDRKSRGEQPFDGWHRILAMQRYLIEKPNDKIEVTLHIYNNLNDDEERDEYTIVNKGMKQTTNDVVRQYEDEIPIFNQMKNGWRDGTKHTQMACKVTSYPSPTSHSFFRLVSAYFACTNKTWGGGYVGDAFTFVAEAKLLKIKDVKIINAFMLDFIDAFGPIKNNAFLRTTPFQAIMKIWMQNKEKIPQPTMISLFKKRLRDDAQVDVLSKSGGCGATLVARDMFVTMLNAGRKRYLFV